MKQLIERFSHAHADPTDLLVALIDQIRPSSPDDFEMARGRLRDLCHLLDLHPEVRETLRMAVSALNRSHRHLELYTSTGILPNTGFFTECFRRIGHKLLPEALDADLLRTTLRRAFSKPSDGQWVTGVGEDIWLELIEALQFEEQPPDSEMPRPLVEMLRSLRVLSFWIAAFGMEPELLRIDPTLETYESPFVAQNAELVAFIAAYPDAWRQAEAISSDDRHLRVLLDQCLNAIEKIRKRAARDGTSIRLTFHLHRLHQLIVRSEELLDILVGLLHDPDGKSVYRDIVRLFTRLIQAECQRDNLGRHWRQNTELIALRITRSTGQQGERYIADNRQDYRGIARSAAVGGLVIGALSVCKLLLANLSLAPLNAMLVNCLNYGLCFCLIHVLHGTVATKQPAMTANAIAGAISQNGGRLGDIAALTVLIARTFSSQVVAIFGNILVAVPVAAALTAVLLALPVPAFVDPGYAVHLIADQSPIHGGAIFYAAVTGLWLFCSGLVSGYFDNYAIYNRIPKRIRQISWLTRLIGKRRQRHFANYIGKHLGALMGSLCLGCLLGVTTFAGLMTGLPIDSRHVAFSSAFLGVSMATLGPALDLRLLMWAIVGIAAIGATNLVVSFTLALNVALRARQITGKPWRMIARNVLKHLFRQPRDFFLPPKNP
jgi:site-specific recombinase